MAKPKPRPKTPRRMRLTERDKTILQTIYEFEGLISKKQIAMLCFGGNEDWAKKRMRLLFENGYVRQPDATSMHRVPIGEWIYWLDHLGLETVAGLLGDDPLYTDKARTVAPQWGKIEHNLAINDFRLKVLATIANSPFLILDQWVNEKTLNHWGDEVTWTPPNGRPAKKRFAMDGFFVVRSRKKLYAYLLEIDKGTHSNPAFVDEKVRPGVVYLTSPLYEQRFGVKYGRYLVVTAGGKRLENMMKQTERVQGGEAFYFTTFAAVSPETVLTGPIWRKPGTDNPFALIQEE